MLRSEYGTVGFLLWGLGNWKSQIEWRDFSRTSVLSFSTWIHFRFNRITMKSYRKHRIIFDCIFENVAAAYQKCCQAFSPKIDFEQSLEEISLGVARCSFSRTVFSLLVIARVSSENVGKLYSEKYEKIEKRALHCTRSACPSVSLCFVMVHWNTRGRWHCFLMN